MTQFFQDSDGNYSSMRLAMLVTVFVIMGGWLYVVITTKSMPDIPMGVVGMASLAILGKGWQNHVEAK